MSEDKLEFIIRVEAREITERFEPLYYTTLAQSVQINHLLPLDKQIEIAQQNIKYVMKNLWEKHHEKNKLIL